MEDETSLEDVCLRLSICNCESKSAISPWETGDLWCGKLLFFTWCFWLTGTPRGFLGVLNGAEAMLLEREGNGCNEYNSAIKNLSVIV